VLLCSKKDNAKITLEIDARKFKKICNILKRFFFNSDLQLDLLYAAQYLDHRIQHSSKYLMHQVFKLLHDEEIIRASKVYFKWKDEDYEEGHTIVVESLKNFFKWLLKNYRDYESNQQIEYIPSEVETDNPIEETANLNESPKVINFYSESDRFYSIIYFNL
jgi:hypothetical protein